MHSSTLFFTLINFKLFSNFQNNPTTHSFPFLTIVAISTTPEASDWPLYLHYEGHIATLWSGMHLIGHDS